MQTLHQAEQSYSYESDPHEASTWARRRGMDNLGPYRYSDPKITKRHGNLHMLEQLQLANQVFQMPDSWWFFTVSVEEIITGSPMISCGM